MSDDNLVLEDASIIFRNFSGQASQFNPEGKRNFCVLLDSKLANKLKLEGWNIRWSDARIEGEEPQAYMQVAVSYDNYPPSIFLVTKNNKILLSQEEVGMLDWSELKNLDMIIRPYSWEVNGNKGVKGYLKSMYATILEDAFSDKYADIPGSNIPG